MVLFEYKIKCSHCTKEEIRPTKPLGQHTGWWFFASYTTKLGNTYTGQFCPDCSDKVYDENKYLGKY